jgi:hypothetical protein
MWPMGAEVERGDLPRQDLETAQRNACPTCGACQFMGSASTGQVMAEALGLALPGSALTPAPLTRLLRYARATGKQLVTLIEENLTPRRILTRNAFENAIVLHAAVGGSTNALLHLPVIAREAGVDISIDDFDRIHRRVPVLAELRRMKPTLILVNTARGPIINDDALYLALKDGGSPAPVWTTSRRNPPSSGTGSRRTRCSVWTTWSSHHMRRTTPKRRSARSATLPHMR